MTPNTGDSLEQAGLSRGVPHVPGLERALREMPFDQFGRYHMLREAVDACRARLGVERLSILEVGGFFMTAEGQPSLPIKQFLPDDDVTVVDVVDCDLPGYVKGDGAALHFAAGQFDLVVSSDTLEHIPQERRVAFWHELLRVARGGVILLAPFGTVEVEAAEALLSAYIKAELSVEQPQLKEHSEYGLPRLAEWLGFLEREGIAARAYPTGYLHAWLAMMMAKHTRIEMGVAGQRLLDAYYNRCFFPTERRRPAYRYLIVAEKTAGLVEAVDDALAPTLMPDQADASADWGRALQPVLLTIAQRQLSLGQQEQRQQRGVLERMSADQQAVLSHLQQLAGSAGQAAQYEAAIRDLTERANWLESQNRALRQQLDAVRNGRVMRILNRLTGRS